MKPEDKEIIRKANHFIIAHLDLNSALLASFEQNEIFDAGTIQEISVRDRRRK